LKTARHLASGENHYFSYSERGYYKSVATDDFKVEFDYDQFGNRIRDERDGLGVKHRFSSCHYLAGTTVLSRFRIQYRFQNRHLVITDPTGKEHTLGFSGKGVVVRRMSNGSAELAQYDSRGRCLFKSHARRHGVEGFWTRGYSYSGEGDLLETRDNLNGPTRYDYDAAHRLKTMRRNEKQEDFQYDAAHNLLRQPGLDGVSHYEGNRLRTANGDEFEYNGRNNIAARRGAGATTRYHYDSRDMLTSCETPAGEWRAIYDPLGRRISKTFGRRRREFYWDSDRLAAEVDEDGRVRIYVYADAFAMTPILFVEYESIDADPASGKRYFIFSDHLGSPALVEDDNGKAVWQARLDPYGKAHIQSKAAIEMPLRFPGHYFDPETGLHYNRFRYYSPELGRYLQPDPLGVAGGVNLYAYTHNPLKQVDVRGDETPCPDGTPKKPEEDKNSSEEDRPDAEGTTPRAADGPVQPYEIGKYSELRDRYVKHNRKDGTPEVPLEMDHQPSRAALVEAEERSRREQGLPPLTKEERDKIRDEGLCVAVPPDVHKAGPTWFHKNNREQIEGDAADLSTAAKRDSEAMVENAAPDDKEAAAKAAEQIQQQDFSDYSDGGEDG
jgi:RHS repeat-associated protein